MDRWIYPLGAIALGFTFLCLVFLFERRRARLGKPHTWLSYLLGWPLILDVDREHRAGRVLTRRELMGWGLVLAVAILAIWLTPQRVG